MKSNIESIKVLVVDDEALARKRISNFLIEGLWAVTILQASNGKESIKMLIEEKPDLVFLDIKMTDMTGFDVLKQIPKDIIPIVIFVTAFNDFAVNAFEVQAIDFLLKPYKKDRFIAAMERGVQQLELYKREAFQSKIIELMNHMTANNATSFSTPRSYLENIVVKSNRAYSFIPTDTILYIKSSAYYAEIFTVNKGKYLHRISMKELAFRLDPTVLLRINRSAIINLKHIKEVISEGMGDFSVVMNDKSSFGISKSYKTAFLKHVGIK